MSCCRRRVRTKDVPIQHGLPCFGVVTINPYASYKSACQKFGCLFVRKSVCTLSPPGEELVIGDPRDLAVLLKTPSISSLPTTELVAVNAFRTKDGLFTDAHSMLRDVSQYLIKKDGRVELCTRFADAFQRRLLSEKAESESTTLGEFVFTQIWPAMVVCFFGEGFLDVKKDIDDFHTFEHYMAAHAANIIPFSWIGASVRLYKLMQERVSQYDFEGQASMFIRACNAIVPDDDLKASTFIGFLVATTGQSVPTMYWMLARLLTNQAAMDAVRADVHHFIESGYKVTDIPMLDNPEMLAVTESLFWETGRMDNLSLQYRVSLDDVTVDFPSRAGKPLHIPKGQWIAIAARRSAYDPEVFQSPDEFWFHRFLPGPDGRAPSFYKKGVDVSRSAVNFFGGGATMCPGRIIARQFVKVAIVTMFTKFEIALESPDQPLPKQDYKKAPLPGFRRDTDLKIKIKQVAVSESNGVKVENAAPHMSFFERWWQEHQAVKSCLEDLDQRKSHADKLQQPDTIISNISGGSLDHLGASKGRSGAVVLYASQTGTSAGFAKQLGQFIGQSLGAVQDVEVADIGVLGSQGLMHALLESRWAFFICSTYGEGEAPIGSEFLMECLSTSMNLKGLRVGVFGCGSSLYDSFNALAIQVHAALMAAQASEFVPLMLGDANSSREDGTLEEDFEEWFEAVIQSLSQDTFNQSLTSLASTEPEVDPRAVFCQFELLPHLMRKSGSTASLRHEQSARRMKVNLNGKLLAQPSERLQANRSERPVYAKVVSHQQAAADVYYVEFEKTEELQYKHGDHLGVFPQNSPAMVDRIAKVLRVNTSYAFRMGTPSIPTAFETFPTPICLREAFTHMCDVQAAPSRRTLLVASKLCIDQGEAATLRIWATKEHYRKAVLKPRLGLIDILERFPSCTPSLPHFFLNLAPRIKPRLYSIASSSEAQDDTIAICVRHVREQLDVDQVFQGFASRFISEASVNKLEGCDIYIRSSAFRLPSESSTPIIMVGPGTGLAPFLGFCQYREAQQKAGANLGQALLFTGFRKDKDVIFHDELKRWLSCGVLSNLYIAMSQPAIGKKEYVQDQIWNNREAFANALKTGSFYICGDAGRMARDVESTMLELAVDQGLASNTESACEFLKKLKKEGRYRKDVYAQVDPGRDDEVGSTVVSV